MTMTRLFLGFLAFGASVALAQPAGEPTALHGRIDGRYYVAPSGVYRIAIPVLEELGGKVTDTDNSVTFKDDYNVYISIVCFPQDATQRWELSTRGLKDYLQYFFLTYVLPDLRQASPGFKVESAKFSPSIVDGALLVYTLTPGGSMFGHRLSLFSGDHELPVAKRAMVVYVHNEHIHIVSTELAERVLEGRNYHKTAAEEDELLRQRLIDILTKIEYRTEPAK